MRILIITQYFWPENFRINEVSEELVKLGHEVFILTGYPNYPKGEIYFVSYAQSGAIDRTSSSLSRSKTIAENIARSQIAQFQSEALDIFSRLEKAELNTTYKDGMIQTYSAENLVARTRAASRLNIKGVETYDWWATVHPYTKKPVVGVILTWQPSNAVMQDYSTETTTFDDLGF